MKRLLTKSKAKALRKLFGLELCLKMTAMKTRRKLKTASSERLVPLIGYSYWAAEQIMQIEGQFLFSNYTSVSKCNSNSASAALNKWLKPRVPEGCVVHSFRHALRDRLRSVECPSDISDAIGGWSTSGIGHSYGDGYDLAVKQKWLQKIVI